MPLKRHRDWMLPRTSNEPFIEYEEDGGTWYVPADVENTLPDDVEINARYDGKWFGRLTPDGCYTDSTDWSGPYDSEEQAQWEMYEMYDDQEDCTFFHFIGGDHAIQKGTLDVRGDHLWGTVLGEKHWKDPRLVHIAHSNGLSRQEYEDDEGNEGHDDIEGAVINKPMWSWLVQQLGEAYGFEVPTGDEKKMMLAYIRKAQGASR